MGLRTYPDIEQGTDDWYALRCGLVTASAVGVLVTARNRAPIEFPCPDCGSSAGSPCVSKVKADTPIKTVHSLRQDTATVAAVKEPPVLEVADNDTARGLIVTLAAERITGRVDPTWASMDMQRGKDEEPFARKEYGQHHAPVTEMGFMVRQFDGFQIGCSPDGLVGKRGLIEIKSRRQKGHVEVVLADEVPAQNMGQIQCALLVSGRKWCDYVDFSNGMELYVKRVKPDRRWFDAITKAAAHAEAAITEIVDRYTEAAADLPETERIPDLYRLDDLELKL